jgi:hypothetical protein
MSFRALRSGEKGKSSKTYYTSIAELRQAHPRIFQKAPSSLCVQRDVASGTFVLIETLYRERLDYKHTKTNLAKIFANLLTTYNDPEPWEISR